MDPLEYLEKAGFKAVLREDGRYDVANVGVMEPIEVLDLWGRLKCWPLPLPRRKGGICCIYWWP